MMEEVRKLGVPVPSIQYVDPETWTIIMEYIKGPTLKDELYKLPMKERLSRCLELGEILGVMHEGGTVHGDLTISNVLSENGKLFMIDFGLGDFSGQIENKAVDLVLLSRAIKSTHYAFHIPLFKAFLGGYSKTVGKRGCEETLGKMREIERRGRYSERT
jgi:TP53 regulating kinase-like protein